MTPYYSLRGKPYKSKLPANSYKAVRRELAFISLSGSALQAERKGLCFLDADRRLFFVFVNPSDFMKMEDSHMSEIKNPGAYFSTMVRNSYRDEYRSNDNYYSHVSSVGDEIDLQHEYAKRKNVTEYGDDSPEQQLCENSVENWLLFMEDMRLHAALSSFPASDVEFLLKLAEYRFNQKIYAEACGVTKQATSKRFRRIRKKILEIMQNGLSKT
jgi:DNA-directed RNA polymerase specialized sigma24 family protein